MTSDLTPTHPPVPSHNGVPAPNGTTGPPLGSLVDDTGADTLRRYHAQLEYTALWCARLLNPEERLEAVVPETYDDVMLIRGSGYELHQLKTRDPHLPDWTFSEIVPTLASMYTRGGLLTDKPVSYRFVTNHPANARPERHWVTGVSLRAFKRLLDVRAMGQQWTATETSQYRACCKALIPQIQSAMTTAPTVLDAEKLLAATALDTQSTLLHYPNHTEEHCPRNLVQLGTVLRQHFPGSGDAAIHMLARMCDRLITLICMRIRQGTDIATRRVVAQDVHDCRSQSEIVVRGHPEIDAAPGTTRLEKKAHLAGFDGPRLEVAQMQQAQAEIARRRLPVALQSDAWDALRVSLLDCQVSEWEAAQLALPGTVQLGPTLIERLRPRLAAVVRDCRLSGRDEINEAVCFGVLWKETAQCRAYWHGQARGSP